MALGVPETVLALGLIPRYADGFSGSPGFSELIKRMQHVVLHSPGWTRIEGCSQSGSSLDPTPFMKPDTLWPI